MNEYIHRVDIVSCYNCTTPPHRLWDVRTYPRVRRTSFTLLFISARPLSILADIFCLVDIFISLWIHFLPQQNDRNNRNNKFDKLSNFLFQGSPNNILRHHKKTPAWEILVSDQNLQKRKSLSAGSRSTLHITNVHQNTGI